jgi:hypothetical protein
LATIASDFRLTDRIWIAAALLHQELPNREDFSKDEVRRKLDESSLTTPEERKSVNPHLDQHMVVNHSPSTTTKYRMLFETNSGNLRLYRPGDHVDSGRQSHRSPKYVPRRDQIPAAYHALIDWYEKWCKESKTRDAPINWEDDPLIRLIGSGKHIWADEHADEYVERLREEPA